MYDNSVYLQHALWTDYVILISYSYARGFYTCEDIWNIIKNLTRMAFHCILTTAKLKHHCTFIGVCENMEPPAVSLFLRRYSK